jgi:hypothetical protein
MAPIVFPNGAWCLVGAAKLRLVGRRLLHCARRFGPARRLPLDRQLDGAASAEAAEHREGDAGDGSAPDGQVHQSQRALFEPEHEQHQTRQDEQYRREEQWPITLLTGHDEAGVVVGR